MTLDRRTEPTNMFTLIRFPRILADNSLDEEIEGVRAQIFVPFGYGRGGCNMVLFSDIHLPSRVGDNLRSWTGKPNRFASRSRQMTAVTCLGNNSARSGHVSCLRLIQSETVLIPFSSSRPQEEL